MIHRTSFFLMEKVGFKNNSGVCKTFPPCKVGMKTSYGSKFSKTPSTMFPTRMVGGDVFSCASFFLIINYKFLYCLFEELLNR